MWGRSGMERNSLNRKPDCVKINVSLRKLRQVDDEEEDDKSKKYRLTPRTSLRSTLKYVRNTIVSLNKESSKIFTTPKPSKTACKLNSGNSTITGTFNAKNNKTTLQKSIGRKHKLSEKDSLNKPKLAETKVEHQAPKTGNKMDPVALDRMIELGLALDWNPSTAVKSRRDVISRKKSQGMEISAPNDFNSVIGNFSAELDCMKSHLQDTRSKNEQVGVTKLKKSSLENGWVNYGSQRNCQLPHPYICPFEDSVDAQLGKLDGIVTLEALMEHAYESKEKASAPSSVISNGKRRLMNTAPMQCQLTKNSLPEKHKRYFSTVEQSTGLPINEPNVLRKGQLWVEKANRWASRNESLNELSDEEKLTRAWTDSLARWEAEKKDLLAEASKNHYSIGKRFQTQFQNTPNRNQQNYSTNQCELKQATVSQKTPSNENPPYPFVMSKGDIKAFCYHWDQSTEPIRNTLMVKFLKLYSGWGENQLDMEEVLSCGSKLLFMRFAFGFKVSFIKKYRSWRYIECLIVFLQSIERITFAKQLMEINILEDLLELIRYDESYLFDKLQGLYFLAMLLEGPTGNEVTMVISCSGKFMDLLLEFFIRCEDPQTLVLCRNILLSIIKGSDLNTSQVILETISHLKFNEQTPLKIELIFQVIKCFVCIHPLIISSCGPLILENLNTKDIDILLGLGELAATMTEHPQCLSIIKGVFDKALCPLIDEGYRSEYLEFIEKSEEKLQASNNENLRFSRKTSSTGNRRSERQSDIGTRGTAKNDTEGKHNEQFSAFFVINHILENKDFSEALSELGAIGLSLIATGQSFSTKIQQEGIRLIQTLHQMSFDCAASLTLLLGDEILSNILTRDIECLSEVSSDVLLCMRQLGYLMLENWKLWMEQVLLPTKRELKKDFDSAMSKEDDYVVDLDYSNGNGTNTCQQIIFKALKTPLGQQVAEILEKLKYAWFQISKKEEDSFRSKDFSSKKLNEFEKECDQESDWSTSTNPDNWVTYNSNSELKPKLRATAYLPQARENDASYIEELEDSDWDSYISHSNDADTEADEITSEEESVISNYSDTPIKHNQTSVKARITGKEYKSNPNQDKNQNIHQISRNASLMRKTIQKYQKMGQ